MTRFDAIIGIDPGVSGGLAILTPDINSTWIVECHPMPEDLWLIRELIVLYNRPLICIEQVPKWCGILQFGRKNIPGSSMATLYGNYQFCLGICCGLGLEPLELTPQRWQSTVECRNVDRLDSPAWKRKLKALAQVIFPHNDDITLATADAALIAVAGLRLTRLYS